MPLTLEQRLDELEISATWLANEILGLAVYSEIDTVRKEIFDTLRTLEQEIDNAERVISSIQTRIDTGE